ncbi:putative protein related to plant photosystem II stability/assembly factor [Variovorax sp. PBL-H6]|uniref:WD40/YVTN/BNR-like repeat-containing protein n=1 Tax=Variovorax sp. PBL-H6 TaxID=434009 RepID=UPI001318DDB2|nr:hypothetical protein [Variovorax sp. PBL-H6]VTU34839.1 putative protein related to plant photosystem II stability/assembly factor [Variovorax sp. PBL-H6]
MRTSYALTGSLILSLLLSACGGGGSNGSELAALAALAAVGTATSTSTGASTVDPGTDGTSTDALGANTDTGASTGTGTTTDTSGTSTIKINTLLAVNVEESGLHCASGGVRIDAGLDSDGNGQLSASEVGSAQYMCQGAAGPSGTLVQMRDEPRGAHCADAGKAIHVGIDGDGNRMLDDAEISSTGYVCNGTDGTIAASGLNMLASVVSDAAAANCAGGSKVIAGLDSNANGMLDADEISATSYICNCAGGPQVDVTGAAVQAQPNTCYIARNATAQVVVTLPANPVIGDVVRVRGAGMGGWKVAQNPGQSVDTKNLGGMAGANWTMRESNLPWTTSNPFGDAPFDRRRVVFSADGSKLAASVFDGQIYTSTDSGASWTAHESDRAWQSIASSADGTKLVAADGRLGQIYTSTDSGVSWTARDSGRRWSSVASSADGSKLVAAPEQNGQLYTSTDSGVSWTARGPSRSWTSVASSADGSKLVAAASSQLYTSTDSGISWTARESAQAWTSVASSADGSKLVAVASLGRIYTSTDSGVSWTARGESDQQWSSVASSGDGSKLVAVAVGGQIYTSIDSGVSWTARESNRIWYWVAASADASRMVAIADGFQIFMSEASTTLGAGGSISGSSSDSIDLRYAGNGVFAVLSHEGSLTTQ